jgi:hypothetical protein
MIFEKVASSSNGEEPDTIRVSAEGLREALTRQMCFILLRQHLRINTSFATTENAANNQRWITVAVRVVVEIAKNCLYFRASF